MKGDTVTNRIAAIVAAACIATPIWAQSEMTQGHLEALDTNGDGAVSREEFDAFAARTFQQLDRNSDRMLSESEVEGSPLAGSMSDLDADGDGMVSRQEFGRQMSADFAAADKDGNGMID